MRVSLTVSLALVEEVLLLGVLLIVVVGDG